MTITNKYIIVIFSFIESINMLMMNAIKNYDCYDDNGLVGGGGYGGDDHECHYDISAFANIGERMQNKDHCSQ